MINIPRCSIYFQFKFADFIYIVITNFIKMPKHKSVTTPLTDGCGTFVVCGSIVKLEPTSDYRGDLTSINYSQAEVYRGRN
jgi:hypothetical protein